MGTLELKCQCGNVEASADNIAPNTGNHVKCYCHDCQAFANHLIRTARSELNPILDEVGGTEIYQTAPWNITFHKGLEHVQCLRLTPKGLNRWYAKCCNTPIGNTINADLPFVGIIHNFIVKDTQASSCLGPIVGHHKLEHASGQVPPNIEKMAMPLLVTLKVFWRIFKWKAIKKGKLNPFFNDEGRTICKPVIISK